MSQVLPDLDLDVSREFLAGNKPIPDSSVKDRLQWRLKGT